MKRGASAWATQCSKSCEIVGRCVKALLLGKPVIRQSHGESLMQDPTPPPEAAPNKPNRNSKRAPFSLSM
eukprot:9469999-Pyramimonas_sp.AAC.2